MTNPFTVFRLAKVVVSSKDVNIDPELLWELLDHAKGSTLDFKELSYPFEGANENQKSELLKDVLAFANTRRDRDAYILLGVQEVEGSRSEVVGIKPNELDDAKQQQFVRGKIQRNIEFSYSECEISRKQVGVLRIPVQRFGPI